MRSLLVLIYLLEVLVGICLLFTADRFVAAIRIQLQCADYPGMVIAILNTVV